MANMNKKLFMKRNSYTGYVVLGLGRGGYLSYSELDLVGVGRGDECEDIASFVPTYGVVPPFSPHRVS